MILGVAVGDFLPKTQQWMAEQKLDGPITVSWESEGMVVRAGDRGPVLDAPQEVLTEIEKAASDSISAEFAHLRGSGET